MKVRLVRLIAELALAVVGVVWVGSAPAAAGPAYGSYGWPVVGPVIRGFEPPHDPYSSGHRGIDIAAPFGSDLFAAADGTVAFAGWVAGSLFISIDHLDGVRTTYSWLSAVSVVKGAQVSKGQRIGATGHGHPDVATTHLHFGARVGTTYLDPMLLLVPGDVSGLIHLAPLDGGATRPSRSPDWGATGAEGTPPTMGGLDLGIGFDEDAGAVWRLFVPEAPGRAGRSPPRGHGGRPDVRPVRMAQALRGGADLG